VHQVRPARHGRGLERQRLDEIGLGLRRRRDGRTIDDLVQVVDQPDMDAALVRADECAADDVARLVLQSDVVERQFECLLRAVDERRDLARDVGRRLAAVGERVNVDQSPRGDVARVGESAGVCAVLRRDLPFIEVDRRKRFCVLPAGIRR
jgi:hypothetical protein